MHEEAAAGRAVHAAGDDELLCAVIPYEDIALLAQPRDVVIGNVAMFHATPEETAKALLSQWL